MRSLLGGGVALAVERRRPPGALYQHNSDQNSGPMRSSCGDDMPVPDGVAEGQGWHHVKDHADRIGYPANQQQQE